MTIQTCIAPTLSGAPCLHCGQASPRGPFCCAGCHAAYDLIEKLGLGTYYLRRALDPAQRPLQPEPQQRADMSAHITTDARGMHTLFLAIDGLQCGACVWLIEAVLAREPVLASARVNLTTRRLRLSWRGETAEATRFCDIVERLGYRVAPFAAPYGKTDRAGSDLLRAMAVAGFAAGNVMLISLGSWFGATQNMGPETLQLMHWMSALIAMPAILYAGRPFFRSAARALAHGRTNMDVPISLGVTLVTAMSLWQTVIHGANTYFDSACSLLFFLLIGRVLDQRARGQARSTAEHLLLLRTTDICLLAPDGTASQVPQTQLRVGNRVLVGLGERVGIDGTLESAAAQLDTSIVTGESLPESMQAGAQIFAGSLNLGAAIILRVSAVGEATLLAECVRLIEAAEQARGRFVVLADRIARLYTPVVHVAAAATCLGWWLAGRSAGESLMAAVSVLIVTCPCALALAVPVVQVVATSRLFRAGILLKSPTALERMAQIDTVVFDKTGTLTAPSLALASLPDAEALACAARLAANSRHPLCRALSASAGPVIPLNSVVEAPGKGLSWDGPDGETRLGSREFCGLPETTGDTAELCLVRPACPDVVFTFTENPRVGANSVIDGLQRNRFSVRIASGDRPASVARIAEALGIRQYAARQTPLQKAASIVALQSSGHRVLMVGDGLNDSPALAASFASAAPCSAADISQTVADVVYFGESLAPVGAVLRMARRVRRKMQENLALSFLYNAVMLPLAACGYVTPWVAALAMSSSSMFVIVNALRLQGGRL